MNLQVHVQVKDLLASLYLEKENGTTILQQY